ncbi:hypothetical protein ACJX0J_021349, partial [Zea mays]
CNHSIAAMPNHLRLVDTGLFRIINSDEKKKKHVLIVFLALPRHYSLSIIYVGVAKLSIRYFGILNLIHIFIRLSSITKN